MSKSRVGYFVEEIDDLPYIQPDTTAFINEQPKKKNPLTLILILVLLILMLFPSKHGVNTQEIFLMMLQKNYY